MTRLRKRLPRPETTEETSQAPRLRRPKQLRLPKDWPDNWPDQVWVDEAYAQTEPYLPPLASVNEAYAASLQAQSEFDAAFWFMVNNRPKGVEACLDAKQRDRDKYTYFRSLAAPWFKLIKLAEQLAEAYGDAAHERFMERLAEQEREYDH